MKAKNDDMFNYFLIATGAALGGAFRFWVSGSVYRFLPANFPYGTLTVNVLGSFLLGFIIFFLDAKKIISPELKIFLTIGFCGGFTTFSTFAFETVSLLKDTELFFAFINILLNVVLTLGAVYLSYLVAKSLA
ncbi:MAG: fluoride efflux transporter CrcB [Melioribacteraceae bacterium]